MDYKYIEQLLERYWNCQTTLEEERILRSFFSQEDVPAQLLQYKDLFDCEKEIAEDKLGEDFDAKMMQMIEQPKTVRLGKLTFKQRIMPLVKAAAVVAVIVTIGNMLEEAISENPGATQMADTYVKTEDVNAAFSVEDTKQTASVDSTAMQQAASITVKDTHNENF